MYTKKYKSRNIRGKLKVCRYLRANPATKRVVPNTKAFTLANLRQMTDRYSAVYIKPDIGSMGIGIFKLTSTGTGYTLYSTSKRKQSVVHFSTRQAVYKHINKKKGTGKLIIQKAILLDTVDGKPYDIRAMVQRKPGKSWVCTGYLVKVGKPDRIVTNYYQGGKIFTLAKWMGKKGWKGSLAHAREQELSQTALTISKTLSKRRSGMHEMGIDFAYDQQERLWVLEVNSNHPQFYPLRKLDRAAFQKMKDYARSYGRNDA
ncbi:YheC/YheD family protein [Paenibacillus daejeonensis]|uniref:YheC/YheD family protein n=1 Tax=Paenibacillus daejeonensis TaxID=135193 RepID=UPI0003813D8C|nr:YheC/YheD family protein [Paenibacillus daejeonensis]